MHACRRAALCTVYCVQCTVGSARHGTVVRRIGQPVLGSCGLWVHISCGCLSGRLVGSCWPGNERRGKNLGIYLGFVPQIRCSIRLTLLLSYEPLFHPVPCTRLPAQAPSPSFQQGSPTPPSAPRPAGRQADRPAGRCTSAPCIHGRGGQAACPGGRDPRAGGPVTRGEGYLGHLGPSKAT